MSDKRWVGFDVNKGEVVIVQFLVPPDGPITVERDDTWKVQSGDRPDAYRVMFKRVFDYLRERSVDAVAIVGSAVSGQAANTGLLEGAEVRGVVMAASATAVRHVVARSKGSLSRSSTRGRVDLYTGDDKYWASRIKTGKLRKGSRTVGYLIITEASESVQEAQ